MWETRPAAMCCGVFHISIGSLLGSCCFIWVIGLRIFLKSALVTIDLLPKAPCTVNRSYELKITTNDSLQKLRSCNSWGRVICLILKSTIEYILNKS